jgi:ribose transport system substrate-binding protein
MRREVAHRDRVSVFRLPVWSVVVVTALLVAASPLACRDTPTGTEDVAIAKIVSEKDSRPTVALVVKTSTNPFWVTVEQGARKAQKDLDVDLVVKTGAKETSVEQQISIVEQLIAERVDAIVIAPVSATELIPALARAKEAGIVIVNMDEPLDAEMARAKGLDAVPLIVGMHEQGAYLAAQYLSQRFTSPAKVAIVEGIRLAESSEARKRGALRAFGENPNLQVVATESANWKIDEARAVAERMFTAHPDLAGIFCANDMMALGVIRYLEEAGKKDVLVAGYDDLDEARAAIREGKLLVTVNQQAEQRGYIGVQLAVRGLRGEKLPAITPIEVKLITAETLR